MKLNLPWSWKGLLTSWTVSSLGVISLLWLLSQANGWAGNATWTGAAGDNYWTTSGNWSASAPGSATATSSDVATFSGTVANMVVDLPANRYMGALVFSSGAGAYTIGGVDPGILYMNSSGTVNSSSILVNAGVSSNETIGANIVGVTSTTGTRYFAFTNNGTGLLTIGGNVTGVNYASATTSVLVNGSGNIRISGIIADGATTSTLSLTKSGTGTLTLSGANTYTGNTSITGGSLNVDFANSAVTSNILGTGTLSFGMAAPNNQVTTGTVNFIGKADTADTQALAGLLYAGAGSYHIAGTTSGSGTLVINLGSYSSTRVNGAVLDLVSSSGVTYKTSASSYNGLLAGAITLNGTDFATVDASGNIVAATYTTNTASGLAAGTAANVDVIQSSTLNKSTTVNSLRFNTATDMSISMTSASGIISVNGNNSTGAAAAILVTSNVGAHNNLITGGLITGLGSRDLTVIQNNTQGNLEIDSVIYRSGTSTALTKAGQGTLIVGGANTYNSTTFINEGTMIVTGDATASSSFTITAASGATYGTVSSAAGLTIGQTVTTSTGLAASVYIVGISGNTVTLSAAFTAAQSGSTMTAYGTGGLGVNNNNLNGATAAVQVGSGATLQIGNGGATGSLYAGQSIDNQGTVIFNRTGTLNFNNPIIGKGSVQHNGSGTTIVSYAQGYSGGTTINNGVYEVTGSSGSASSQSFTATSGSYAYTVTSTAGLSIGQAVTSSGANYFQGTAYILAMSGNTITLSSPAGSSTTGTSTMNFSSYSGLGTGTTTVSGGKLLLASSNALQTYTGALIIAGGSLSSAVQNTTLGSGVTMTAGNIAPGGDLASATASLTLAAGTNFTISGGTLTLRLAADGTSDQILGTSNNGIFTISGGVLSLDIASLGGDYSKTYTLFSGFGLGDSVSFSSITGYDTSTELAVLSLDSINGTLTLSFESVPEPTAYTIVLVSLCGLIGFNRVRRDQVDMSIL